MTGAPLPFVDIPALLKTAIAHHQSGRLDQAEALYRQILSRDPNHAGALHLLGLAAHQAGQHARAVELIAKAIALSGDQAIYHNNLGAPLQALGRWDEAIAAFAKAVDLAPAFTQARFNLAATLAGRSQWDRAAQHYAKILETEPDHADALTGLGGALLELGQAEQAVAMSHKAVQLAPDRARTHFTLGLALKSLGRPLEAVGYYQGAIDRDPGFAAAHNSLGNALRELGRLDEAASSCRRAIALDPGFAPAYNSVGVVEQEAGNPGQAVLSFQQATRLKPDFAEAFCNLGSSLKDLGRFDEAQAAYRRALALDPDYVDANANLSHVLLLAGDFREGWARYEWRWRRKHFGNQRRHRDHPQWDGRYGHGATVLVWAEQGMGDTIQFIRYLPKLADAGWRVLFEVPKPMMRLLGRIDRITLIPMGETPPAFDMHCPLLSLPGLFHTDLTSIPAPIPYLAAEAERVRDWLSKLPRGGFRIGVAWQGSPVGDGARSVPLAALAPLAQGPGVRLISLQKTHGLDQLDRLPDGMRVDTLGPDFDAGPDAFVDTGAVMMGLDLIVTSDTSIAHLAGALGRPVWVMLKASPEWRWLLGRSDSPWYPTMRLFRQPERGNWDAVAAAMAAALSAFFPAAIEAAAKGAERPPGEGHS